MPNYFKLFSSSRSLLRTDFYGLLFGAAPLDSTDPFNTLLQITRDGKLGTLKVDSETVDLKETISDWLHFFFLFLFLLLSFFFCCLPPLDYETFAMAVCRGIERITSCCEDGFYVASYLMQKK